MDSLLAGVIEQKDKVNVIFDFDSQIYAAAYKHKDKDNIELVYIECFIQLSRILGELYKSYEVGEVILSLTSKKNFRHNLTDKWKANRAIDINSASEAQKQALKLKTIVSNTKALLNERLASSPLYKVMVDTLQESDDRCVAYSREGWIVVAIDSDVILSCQSPVFNPKKWKWEHEGLQPKEIFEHIISTSLIGGHNAKGLGAKGVGKIKAKRLIEEGLTFDKFVNLFDTPSDMLMNVRVSSCLQVSKNKLTLHTVEDVAKMIDALYPF